MTSERKRKNTGTRRADLANAIAEAIRLRMYRPGEWLRQIDLEERFEATRFDVRGALDELTARKTIEHVPNRGYRVAEIDMKTYQEIVAIRVMLETAAAERAVARIDEAGIARLDELAAQFSAAVLTGSRTEQSEINHAFHQLMYSFCGNAVLQETIWALRDRGRGSRITVWSSHESLLRSDREHYAMMEALKARDAGRLAALVATHVAKGATLVPPLAVPV
ncbi:GntR family transcriptional regulator [Bosea sp. SSUT16]|jgi:DNA-binding GntR family transcriptional regulator|uniref:GntR family transcriptional regulator n=1 Tax=Bosea spartocytisi TaxID=2773451 RepID=A0A927I180_9HYPH|nr:GntR family transcriptional regulator [Bosea spartocytisi]MBD3846178.1 GntR family transcriptional regulator [Bosea spartocytisi]MCT4473362.1 GntR family transcriptional regulator [Bosea spartocytisi]